MLKHVDLLAGHPRAEPHHVRACGSGLGVERREHPEPEPDRRLVDRPLPPGPVDVVALGGLQGVDRLGDAAGVGHGQPASAVVLQLAVVLVHELLAKDGRNARNFLLPKSVSHR